MGTAYRPAKLWIHWLLAASGAVALFGLLLVVAPALARHGFSLLLYGSPAAIDTFGSEQVRYVSLAHAVLGGVMVGWGAALVYVTRVLFPRSRAPRGTSWPSPFSAGSCRTRRTRWRRGTGRTRS